MELRHRGERVRADHIWVPDTSLSSESEDVSHLRLGGRILDRVSDAHNVIKSVTKDKKKEHSNALAVEDREGKPSNAGWSWRTCKLHGVRLE